MARVGEIIRVARSMGIVNYVGKRRVDHEIIGTVWVPVYRFAGKR